MAAYEKRGESDEWYTPRYIFDALGETFDLDVAAPVEGPRHVPTIRWFSSDALERPWDGFIWMNPPFGHQSTKRNWLKKFFENGNGIALLPDRTSAPWWQEFAPMADAIQFVSPKVKFEMPEGAIPEVHELAAKGLSPAEITALTRFSISNVKRILEGESVIEAPGTGTTLLAAGDRAAAALHRAAILGVVFTPIRSAKAA
jgi:hypothetical protein